MYKTTERTILSAKNSGRITVSTQVGKEGLPTVLEEQIEMSDKDSSYDGPYAYVGVHAGFTINMGNFQSAKIEITCTMPCVPEKREAAFEDAKQFCEDKLKGEVVKLEAKRGGGK